MAIVVAGRRRTKSTANPEVAGRTPVLLTDGVDGDELIGELRARGVSASAEILVVVPKLASRLEVWTDDEQACRRSRDRAGRVAASLVAAGFRARGRLGDADPVQALEDTLRSEHADVVVVATPAAAGHERARHGRRRSLVAAAAVAALATGSLVLAGTRTVASAALAVALVAGVVAANVVPKLALVLALARLARRLG